MKTLQHLILLLCFCLPFGLAAQSIEGSWSTQVPDGQGGMMTLKVTMDNGSYAVDFGADGNIEINGKYEISGDQVTIQDTGGPNACNGKGVYKLEISSTAMKMTRVSDECPDRGGPEGVMSWTRA